MHEIRSSMQIDTGANWIIQLVTSRPYFVHFDESDITCHHCNNSLGVYYCEAGTYAVRCLGCKTVTLVKANNPRVALRLVSGKTDGGSENA